MRSLKQYLGLMITAAMLYLVSQFIAGCMTYSGEKLFFKEGCSQCHSFKGRGGRMGPDLSAVTNLRSDNWIHTYLDNPKSVNPFSRMPSFSHLSGAKRRAIIAYLKK